MLVLAPASTYSSVTLPLPLRDPPLPLPLPGPTGVDAPQLGATRHTRMPRGVGQCPGTPKARTYRHPNRMLDLRQVGFHLIRDQRGGPQECIWAILQNMDSSKKRQTSSPLVAGRHQAAAAPQSPARVCRDARLSHRSGRQRGKGSTMSGGFA